MAQQFYIKQNSVNPTLRMELIKDAKYDFFKGGIFDVAIQNADTTFSMWDENGILHISKAPCNLILEHDGTCEERYIIEYAWKMKDTKKKGVFKGEFTINFKDDLVAPNSGEYLTKNNTPSGPDYPKGVMKMPIYEELQIMIL